jgi:hypothetical protein
VLDLKYCVAGKDIMARGSASCEPALAGAAAKIRAAKAFDFFFSGPFATQNDFTPAGQVVPPIEDDRPILVDEASGEFRNSA